MQRYTHEHIFFWNLFAMLIIDIDSFSTCMYTVAVRIQKKIIMLVNINT